MCGYHQSGKIKSAGRRPVTPSRQKSFTAGPVQVNLDVMETLLAAPWQMWATLGIIGVTINCHGIPADEQEQILRACQQAARQIESEI